MKIELNINQDDLFKILIVAKDMDTTIEEAIVNLCKIYRDNKVKKNSVIDENNLDSLFNPDNFRF